jgi:hypothetical protein
MPEQQQTRWREDALLIGAAAAGCAVRHLCLVMIWQEAVNGERALTCHEHLST